MQVKVNGPTGEALGDVFHEQEICGTGKDEPTGNPVQIHGASDGDKQLGASLRLVDDERFVGCHKLVRVLLCRRWVSEIIVGYVFPSFELRLFPQERTLRGLPHAGYGHDRHGVKRPNYLICYLSWQVCHHIAHIDVIMTLNQDKE